MPIVPGPGDYDDGEIGGMIGKGSRSTRRKPAPVPLFPPQTKSFSNWTNKYYLAIDFIHKIQKK
jgi:hypothetical protein